MFKDVRPANGVEQIELAANRPLACDRQKRTAGGEVIVGVN